ncbi:MAG TPA: ABC transporter ATP-binding protein [Nannocystis exedens]|nr:ABC transporter ATP-binding protein [Nannocystis exedens]
MALVIENLSKTYPGGVRALHNVSLTIPTGMFGLLGPNGAGKSTLMRTIATLQEPDSGSIHLGEVDVIADKTAVRRVLGYLPQEFGLYPNLSAQLVLDHFATLKGITNAKERARVVTALLEQTNLAEVRKAKVGGFSGGMKQRLGIAIALIGSPKLVIVDEPTAGLDPTERHRFLNLLSAVGEQIVVILSTHIVEDVRELCSNVAIIARGEVRMTGTPDDLIEGIRGKIWRRQVPRSELAEVKQRHCVISTRLRAGTPEIRVYADECPGPQFKPREPDLEDVYFYQVSRAVDVHTLEAS